ncbi:hypothetical protein [uncultured Thiodictyon sp.]|uniref:hypothetical protein n=1 Tax=uncultured Thiodictyon sp. TaxID=1846217 RepID=UPI0025CD47DB|nr:hypothetical protein [uncultured Thiodictyon sp.]
MGDLRTIIPTLAPEPRIATSRIVYRHSAEDFLGRDAELDWLDQAWADGTHALVIVAWGGVGKTALLINWLQTRFIDRNWQDADGAPLLGAYFDWSFYDQGTGTADGGRGDGDQPAARAGNLGAFFEQALNFFGDPDPNRPGKGERLARLVQAQRTLFVLDGLEPLQYPPGSPQAGQLLDPDLATFIHALAQRNPGLLVITSREHLRGFVGKDRRDLEDLARDTAVALLRQLQITGTDAELAAACERFGCHALSLDLVGRFLVRFHRKDIRRIDCIRDLHEADTETRDLRQRTAWRVLATYEEWLAKAKDDGDPQELAVLRLTGLFDRPAGADLLAALRAAPAIPGLTEALVGLSDIRWRGLLARLQDARLIKLRPEPDERDGIDAHPLIRGYFAQQLQDTRPEAFRAAHARLFEYLCTSTPHRPETLDGLQPLYQAVVHGCLTGRQQEACEKVYDERILRGTGADGFFSSRKLGAINANLGAVAAFFEVPWQRVSANLTAPDQAWLFGEAAFLLRALGRLTEALEPMRAGLAVFVQQEDWNNAASGAGNLSELDVTLGRLTDALDHARAAVDHADRSGDAFRRMAFRITAADALHQSGEWADARAEAGGLFAEAEGMQRERQPQFPQLYSLPGFRYCDWLLAPAERTAWRALGDTGRQPEPLTAEVLACCDDVERRATTTLQWMKDNRAPLLTIALDHLTLARTALLRALLTGPPPSPTLDLTAVTAAVAGLRKAGRMNYLPMALLTAAWCHAVRGDGDSARLALDEAFVIAESGPMPLFLADVRLYRVRLWWAGLLDGAAAPSGHPAGQEAPKPRRGQDARAPDYPWPDSSPAADLAEARRLIVYHGYGRRLPELADAEAAILGLPA